jgi:PAS domain S-box-containing protein
MSKKANLKEQVDLNELQAIQDSFAKTVGTSSVILSPEGEQLTQFSNPTGFCSLIQSTEEGKRRCFLSFMEMSQKALELEEPVMHYCFVHGGHFVAPIIIDGEHKGTIFAGQFIQQKFSAKQLKALEKIAVEINVDPTLLVEEAKKMHVVEEDAVRSYSSLLFQIVDVITRQGAQADELNRAKDALQKAHNGLEIHVQERTAELAKANEELKQEITERTHLTKELDNSYKFLEAVIENIPDAVYLKDSQYRFSMVNQAYCDNFEVKKEEIIGKERVYETDKKIFQTGKAVEIPEQSFTDHKGKRHYTHLKKVPLIDNSGNVTHVLTISRDITERKEVEEALKESEERFRTIFDRAVDGILLMDHDTRRFYMANNAICQMLGYSLEELTNIGPADVIPKEDLPRVMKEIEQVFREEISGGTSIPVKRKDGSVIHTTINGALIEFGGTKYLLAIIRDVTELKKKTEALKRFNKLAVGRELRLIELKKEINALLEDLGKEPRYKIAGEGDEKNYELQITNEKIQMGDKKN